MCTGGDLGLEREVARRSTRCAPNSLIARANASAGAGQRSPGRRFGRIDAPEGREAGWRRARRRPLPSRWSSSSSTGCTVRTTNGSVTNSSAKHDAAPGVREVDADRAVRSVQGEQHEAGDDRRQRERQVDQRVDDALAGEVVAHQHPRDERAHDQRSTTATTMPRDDGQLERGPGLGRGDRRARSRCSPSSLALPDDGAPAGSGRSGSGRVVAKPSPRPTPRRPRAPAPRARRQRRAGAVDGWTRSRSTCVAYLAVETPMSCSIVGHDARVRVEELLRHRRSSRRGRRS